jgi:hypothetical protein
MGKNEGVVHQGRRSWWDSSVKTLCGLKFQPGNEKEEGFFTRVTCPACLAVRKS